MSPRLKTHLKRLLRLKKSAFHSISSAWNSPPPGKFEANLEVDSAGQRLGLSTSLSR
jgi:hypothetical protein